jgi:hypothetical protein
LNNFGLLCFCLALALYAGNEFIDWFWWYHWNDDEDERNPAPFLCMTWMAWKWLREVCFWLWSRVWWLARQRLSTIWGRSFSPDFPDEPVDEDGRTPTEWLLIDIIGIWNLDWFEDDYDQNLKRNWEEYLRSRDAAESPEVEERQTGC